MKYVLKVRTEDWANGIICDVCDDLLEAMEALMERESAAFNQGANTIPLDDNSNPLFLGGFRAHYSDGRRLEAWVEIHPEEDDPIDWVATLNALRERGEPIQLVVRKVVLPDWTKDYYPVLVWAVRDQYGADELALYPDGRLVIEITWGSADYYDLWVVPPEQSRMIYRGTVEGPRTPPTWVIIRPHVEVVR